MALAGFTQTLGFTWTDGSQTLTGTNSATGDSNRYLDQTVPATSGTVTYSMAILASSIKSYYFLSVQSNCTLVLVGPSLTFNLVAGVPQEAISASAIGVAGGLVTQGSNITSITLNNASSTATDVRLRFLLDSTLTS